MSISNPSSIQESPRLIGVVGGGQLAQMLVEAARLRNIDVSVQTSSYDDPASHLATDVVIADPMDANGTKLLVRRCSGVTFENEWIDVEALLPLEQSGIKFSPSLKSISSLIDKQSQRRLLSNLGIPGPDWIPTFAVNDYPIELPLGWTFPVMAKASRGGYDGKGTKVIRNTNDLEKLLRTVNQSDWFLESWVSYKKELSIVGSRDKTGVIRTLPIVETFQKDQVCDWVFAPAVVSHSVQLMAYNIISTILTELNYVGVIAIEFFYGDDGLQVNEIAPRTHNSAHFSIEACTSSQFDQQLCISAGLDSPEFKLIHPGAVMINLLGQPADFPITLDERLRSIRSLEGAYLHWYGKRLESPGRKMGHVTYLLEETNSDDRIQEAKSIVKKIRSIWPT